MGLVSEVFQDRKGNVKGKRNRDMKRKADERRKTERYGGGRTNGGEGT